MPCRPSAADPGEIEEATRELLAPFERSPGEGPYDIHRDLQENMQNSVGIFRDKDDLKRGLEEIGKLKERLSRARVEGSRLFNPGWHLARDLKSMLTVAEVLPPGVTIGCLLTNSRISLARFTPFARLHPGRTIRNSSPP